MTGRTLTATTMAFRDQRRRPVLIVILLVVPAYVITRAIATTLPTVRVLDLASGEAVTTNMQDVHGANMAGIAIAFVAGLVGVFAMQSALQGDRRLVAAGFRPGEVIAARMLVLAAVTGLVVAVSAGVTAFQFEPASWPTFAAALALTGVIYAAIGALAGGVMDKLGATYLILFLVMADFGVVQNPMFGDAAPDGWASVLPAYGPVRLMVDGAFAPGFNAADPLLIALAWTAGLTFAVVFVLRRAVGTRT